MARTQITALSITRAGITPMTPVATDVANGNFIVNDGRLFLRVRNQDSGGSHGLTINVVSKVDGQDVEPRSYTLPASTTRLFGPFPTSQYGAQLEVDADNAQVVIEAYHLPI